MYSKTTTLQLLNFLKKITPKRRFTTCCDFKRMYPFVYNFSEFFSNVTSNLICVVKNQALLQIKRCVTQFLRSRVTADNPLFSSLLLFIYLFIFLFIHLLIHLFIYYFIHRCIVFISSKDVNYSMSTC